MYGRYSDYVGFQAVANINMPRTGMASFRVGSDDGAELFLDYQMIIDNNRQGKFQEKTAKVNLESGKHTLRLKYYEVTGNARVLFDCDHDLLVWEDVE